MKKLVKKKAQVTVAPKTPKASKGEDDRFKAVFHDPLFNEQRKSVRKVHIDERFKEMFTDEKFSIGRSKVDSRGRRITDDNRLDVKALYDLSSDEKESESESEEEIALDLARGTGNYASSDEDSEPTDDEEVEEEEKPAETLWDKMGSNIRRVEWASRRLAIVNLDWDNMKIEDLFAVLLSFKPAAGEIQRLSIYLSDFGAQRMAEENTHGPKIEAKVKKTPVAGADDVMDNETRAAIRSYEFDRLRYFFAVLECDTVETAEAIYQECDRVEYEASGVQLDLRFIPDDTTFDDDRLHESMTMENFNAKKYKPNFFENSSLRLQNPKLTWDEANPDRVKKLNKVMRHSHNDDLSDIEDLIAPGSDEEDEIPEDVDKGAINALLAAAGIDRSGKSNDDDGDFKVEWEPMMDDGEEERLSKKKKTKNTPFQEFLERRKAKKKERKILIKEKKQQAKEEEEENRKTIEASISAAQKKNQRTKKSELAANLVADITDNRFSALFGSADFAIDKTNPNFKGGSLAEHQVKVKQERKRKMVHEDGKQPQEDSSALMQKLKARAAKLKKT